MDTASLKSFATSARIELVREVGARISAVLAQGSPERVELARAVSALERVIAAGGGGDVGRAHVADKVAYIWFNRIVALRFMDANGYTGVGVVSPAADQLGQPEVLAAAKRGQVDGEVVKRMNVATIVGLLNGTRQARPGVDAQAEAYVLLLADYCRYWNGSMPSMFEREGDYTELLIPGNLLAEDSVLNRSVKVLTEEVCQDVEVIGWLYQFYISERKDEVFAGFKKNKKAGADEIPAATQLFTPHWIVRYLVENSLGRLWMLNHPESRLVDQMDYYIAPADEETDFLKITRPEELTVIDPACGSGHMLTYAFDLLYAIYEEEGYTPSQIPSLILSNNLYGTEIDPRAGALAAFALTMKAAAKRKLFLKNPVEPNICVLEPISFSADELSYLVTKDGDRRAEEAFWNQFVEADTFGALIQPDPTLTVRLSNHLATLDDDGDLFRTDALDRAWHVVEQAEYLTPRYAVVVANPPYMGIKSAGSKLQEFVKRKYPASKADLYATFIERAGSLVQRAGLVAMVTMQSWMFLSTYEKLRRNLIKSRSVWTMAHLGANAFDTIGGEVVSTTAFVMKMGTVESSLGLYVRLTDGSSEAAKDKHLREAAKSPTTSNLTFLADAEQLEALPGAQFAYWLPESALDAYRAFDTLGEHTYGQPGLQTSDNALFTRQWFEVSRDELFTDAIDSKAAAASGARWFPLVKGGDFRKWYGNLNTVVNWKNDGQEIKSSINEKYPYLNGNIDYVVKDRGYFFRESITYNRITAGRFAVRYTDLGTIFDVAGSAVFPKEDKWGVLGFLCSSTAEYLMRAQNPTFTVQSGDVAALPYPAARIAKLGRRMAAPVREAVSISRTDWDSVETSWRFNGSPLLKLSGSLADRVRRVLLAHFESRESLARTETIINRLIAEAFDLQEAVQVEVASKDVTLRPISDAGLVRDLISFAVGCMFGRYSLDEAGLILADQGATLEDYFVKVPSPTFMPDADNIIPIVDGDWFEDDIVDQIRLFLRTVFGEQHFEENLRFVNGALGVKNLRDYFVKTTGRGSASKFYNDHVQRYKKRPIYWLFSSPKGSFNALIYMHRYTPSTVSTVLTYLREYVTKLESALQQAERSGNAKEADRLRKVLVELNEYEHDTLYPKASENIVIDLDDGVKANYPKFDVALKRIPGLEAASE
ncbi:BREX-1 system adenine-specific DNA-methyltransferase PglX [Rhodococcus sp. IEGM 1408]|uniref:BREX-1 system adenine-specific DNA-methyltransferase PglX n=1 Tax=Rhodococcus sp. IEGM 1408 TaxID=3082220 RepID=UPI0029544CF4|nr:BREX-1 system adenine-specific DNA-methyltransferase PglX [Rhodococcus sp. IEGM 1408]MDV8002809.1 BREX-1 system adenine-specific DNA-methyltransferase PglX [Rhodococcus sp. IEGM 1408]